MTNTSKIEVGAVVKVNGQAKTVAAVHTAIQRVTFADGSHVTGFSKVTVICAAPAKDTEDTQHGWSRWNTCQYYS